MLVFETSAWTAAESTYTNTHGRKQEKKSFNKLIQYKILYCGFFFVVSRCTTLQRPKEIFEAILKNFKDSEKMLENLVGFERILKNLRESGSKNKFELI